MEVTKYSPSADAMNCFDSSEVSTGSNSKSLYENVFDSETSDSEPDC